MAAQYSDVQTAIRLAQPVAFAGGQNLLPGDSGPKAITALCDFSAVGIPALGYSIDLTVFLQRGYFKAIQALYIDNGSNNGFVTVYNPVFNQSFSLPAGYQGYFPILAPLGSGAILFVTSSGNQLARVSLLNVDMRLGIWAATVTPPSTGAPQAVSDAILDATVSNGRQQVQSISAQMTYVDRSGSIAVANTSQVLMAANPNRQGFLIENIDSAFAEALWINFSGAAVVGGSGSFGLGASSNIAYPGGAIQGVGSNAIQIIAASAGHKFSAVEW